MQELLTTIRDYLRSHATLLYVQDNSILITPDENWLPETIIFPVITLKDGSITNNQKLCNNYLQDLQIIISIFQQALNNPEQLIIGSHNILEMTEDVKGLLIGNKFSLDESGLMNSFLSDESESETFQDEKGLKYIQRKMLLFKYQWQRTW